MASRESTNKPLENENTAEGGKPLAGKLSEILIYDAHTQKFEITTKNTDFEISTENRILNKTVELRVSLGFLTNSRSGTAGLG